MQVHPQQNVVASPMRSAQWRRHETRLQAAIASLELDDPEEKKMSDAALRKAKSQLVVPPVEDRIAQCVKFLERAKKRLAVAETELQSAVQKKSQCEQEVAEGEADLARMREEVPVPADPDENANVEVPTIEGQRFNWSRSTAIHHEGRWKQPKTSVRRWRNVEWGAVQKMLPSTEQDLNCWLDDKQAELRDALDMGDTESAATITGLISRGLVKLANFSVLRSVVSNMVP